MYAHERISGAKNYHMKNFINVRSFNVKCKLFHVMKAYCGNGGGIPRSINLGTRWR
jgi:hypothetical protein